MQLGFIGSGLKGAELGTVFARAENDGGIQLRPQRARSPNVQAGAPRARRGPAHRESHAGSGNLRSGQTLSTREVIRTASGPWR
jgi:hypothetical protein